MVRQDQPCGAGPWPAAPRLYAALITLHDDPVVRLNRAVALAEVKGVEAALAEIDAVLPARISAFAPLPRVRADLLRRVGRFEDARDAYRSALCLVSGSAERRWLVRRLNARL